jgi:hypothetical protein
MEHRSRKDSSRSAARASHCRTGIRGKEELTSGTIHPFPHGLIYPEAFPASVGKSE